MMAQVGYTGGAAQVCNDYTNADTGTGVYSDWYLPSTDELHELYVHRVAIGGFNTTPSYYRYWYYSSSEMDPGFAWFCGFNDGTWASYHKLNPAQVRAVRAF